MSAFGGKADIARTRPQRQAYLPKPAAAAPDQRPPFCCATMQYSIGIESMVLMREVMPASFAAAVFSSDVAVTRPRTFFWFGQMMNQTLNAMISASHMPMPIV